jgi:transcriptional regulator with XRE-family HTH domain
VLGNFVYKETLQMNKTVNAGVGQRVSTLRAQLGVSQQRMARHALSPNASAKNIGRIENGEVTPTVHTLAKIAVVSNVDFAWLVTGQAQLEENKPIRVPGVGKRVEQMRLRNGMSQREAAALLSPNPSAKNVGRIECGEVCPTPRTLRRLAEGLGTSMEYLVNGR